MGAEGGCPVASGGSSAGEAARWQPETKAAGREVAGPPSPAAVGVQHWVQACPPQLSILTPVPGAAERPGNPCGKELGVQARQSQRGEARFPNS